MSLKVMNGYRFVVSSAFFFSFFFLSVGSSSIVALPSGTDSDYFEESDVSSHSDDFHSFGNDDPMDPGQTIPVSPLLRRSLNRMTDGYFAIHKALSENNLTAAQKHARLMTSALTESAKTWSESDGKLILDKARKKLMETASVISEASSLVSAREGFESMTEGIEDIVIAFGPPPGQRISKYYCETVDNNRGAYWLQNTRGAQNPYSGISAKKCGNKIQDL